MADRFIERQDMGDPLSRESQPQDLKSSTSTIDRSYRQQATAVGPVENIFNTLLQASGQVMDAAGQEFTRKIEEDKTLQTYRFYKGMEPSDEATVAGYRAHAVLGVQNSVLEQTATLKKEAETFTGTDEEWEERVRVSQKATVDSVFASHQHLKEDPETLKAITTIYGEQVPQIAAARVGAKLAQEHEKRITGLYDNILLRADGLPPEEQFKVLESTMSDASDAMQLGKKDREKVLMTLAAEKAKQGDLTFIEYTKQYKGGASTSLFDRTAALQEAERSGQQVWFQQNQDVVAKEKLALETAYLNEEFDFDELTRRGQELNKRLGGTGSLAYKDDTFLAVKSKRDSKDKDKPWMHTGEDFKAVAGLQARVDSGEFDNDPGNTRLASAGQGLNSSEQRMVITDAELGAMKLKRETATAVNTDLNADVNLLLKSGQVGVDPFALVQGDGARQKAAVAGVAKIYENAAEQAVLKLPAGATKEQQNAVRQSYRIGLANLLSQGQVENPEWTSKIAVLSVLDMENADKMTSLPQAAKDAIDLYSSLPEGSQIQHAKDPAVAVIMANYQTFRRLGQPEPAALRSAQKAQRNKRALSSSEVKSIAAAAQSLTEDKADTWVMDGISDSQPWMRGLMEREANDMLIATLKAGATDVETAKGMVKKVWDNNYTQLKNGQLVFGSRASLASRMAVHQEDIDKTMDVYKLQNRTMLEDQAGHSIEDMYFDVTPDRGTFTVRSGLTGEVLTLPANLNTMKRGRDGYISNNPDGFLDGIKKDYAAFVQSWRSGKGDQVSFFKQPEQLPEQSELLVRTIGMVENPDRVGWQKLGKTGAYHPYDDNGGRAIGYGHALTPAEVKQGYIELDGTRYGIGGKHPSMITEDVARRIMKRDIAKYEEDLRKSWKGYDALPFKYKGVLLNIAYNTGNALPKNWPKLREQIDRGNDAGVRKEMVTSFRDVTTGNRIPLAQRASIVADRLKLNR